jgi:ATP-dependent helicase HrpB
MEPFDRPEILEADLAGLALDLANWGVTDPAALKFLDPPPRPAWTEAVTLLQRLEALDAEGRITAEGKALARLPLHPRLAHMVHRAGEEGDALIAADLAVLVGERGLGGDGTDLAHRLDRFRGDRSKRAGEARGLARRWAGMAGGAKGKAGDVGRHLARAWPDRVAQAVGARGRYRLANGRAASLDETDSLAASPFLVVADITGAAATGRIRAAAAIERSTIEELFADRILDETSMSFDPATASIRARRIRRLDAIRLDEAAIAIDDPARAADLLAAGIAGTGIGNLPWSKEQKALRARATYLRRLLGEDWPDLSDEALAQDAKVWLAPHIHGSASLREISAENLGHALDILLPWAKRQEMEGLLPSHFDAPSGSRLPIDYEAENGPALEVRVQELFGLDRHPSVAGGKVPLLLVLLSPAHRPIQTTRDLPGFWRGSWKEVAKDLKGRYPKHFWPTDPAAARATARAKPRGR